MLFLVQYSMQYAQASWCPSTITAIPSQLTSETKLVCKAPAVPEGRSAVSPLWCWCWFLWKLALSWKTEKAAHIVSCRNSTAISGHAVCVQNGMFVINTTVQADGNHVTFMSSHFLQVVTSPYHKYFWTTHWMSILLYKQPLWKQEQLIQRICSFLLH